MAKIEKRVNLHTAKKEIREWQAIEAGATFEIGRILTEVKNSEIPRGEWTAWLEEVGYNPRTAQRYMQVYERFHSIDGASDLPISKLTELLPLPVDVDASKFILEAKTKTVRELRNKVREVIEGKERPKSEPKLKQSRKKGSAKGIFDNLIPEYIKKIDRGENYNIQDLIKLAQESEEVQRKTLHFDFLLLLNVEIIIKLAKVTPIEKLLYINDLICELLLLSDRGGGYTIHWDKLELRSYDQAEQELKKCIDYINKEHEGNSRGGFNNRKPIFNRSDKIPAIEILGLSNTTPKSEAKKRYRKLMKLLHPDRGGDALLFDVVKKAYDQSYGGKPA